ncbi:type VI secretion system lipoprotein TssJ [Azohydromonas aeria]|uniref:type VI secretion system lipoprotein TssJ n=1 Tax=Azohydromonas aeria TaxID=2590212 RepID=UPI0012F87B75|nr:type VI secretion system lipoprotein TssJ [Azohydromonas aeria]
MSIGGVGSVIAAIAAGVLGSGCAAPKPPPPPAPTLLLGSIEAAGNLNPSISRRPSPLLLRVYELKSDTAFNNADFVSLYQRDQAELGADLVAREELVLAPDSTRPLQRTLAPETRFIGLLGAFRDLEHATWRSVLPVMPHRTQRLRIRAEGSRLAATVELQPLAPQPGTKR